MIQIGEELEEQLEETENGRSAETSIAYFCQFVDDYTRHATDPMSTAAVCEHQAAGIRLTDQEVSVETIALLLETTVNVIDHLEKKWLDEQLQNEELLHRAYWERRRKQHWSQYVWQMWICRPWKRVARSRHSR